ncbi:MAG: hypothetical protein JST11_28465 [Acidobacteria bacterium]|nr:hypothetical protein [Acidobacteriota bacterium]
MNGSDIRDFYQGIYANTINNTTTKNAFLVSGMGMGLSGAGLLAGLLRRRARR